jgi:hypothetical protein
VFELLGKITWLIFGGCAISMVFGALTLRHHIRESGSAPYVHWLTVALLLGSAAFVLMGVQTGDTPVYPKPVFIPWIRLAWALSMMANTVFLVLYWNRRVEIKSQ